MIGLQKYSAYVFVLPLSSQRRVDPMLARNSIDLALCWPLDCAPSTGKVLARFEGNMIIVFSWLHCPSRTPAGISTLEPNVIFCCSTPPR